MQEELLSCWVIVRVEIAGKVNRKHIAIRSIILGLKLMTRLSTQIQPVVV
jgi:hypothetical protein